MKHLLPLLALLLLIGCIPALPSRPTTPQERNDVIEAWLSLGNTYDVSCKEPNVIVIDNDDDMFSYCRQTICKVDDPGPCNDSCFYLGGPTIVLSTGHTGPGWVKHETFHWLQWCAGMPQDHSDVRIWGEPGKPGLLQKLGG